MTHRQTHTDSFYFLWGWFILFEFHES